jgi:hypothetical protein
MKINIMKFKKDTTKIFLISGTLGLFVLFSAFLIQDFNSQATTSQNNTGYLSAQTSSAYVPLSGNQPGDIFADATGGDFELVDLLQSLFKWGIALAIILAIFFIVLGSVEYMTTDAVFNKKEGIKKIESALAGLILALVSWLILNTINPQLLSTELVVINQRAIQQRVTNPENFNRENDIEIAEGVSNNTRTAIESVSDQTGANTLISGRDIRERSQRLAIEQDISFNDARDQVYESIENGTYGDITTAYVDPGEQNDSFIDNYGQEVWSRTANGARAVGGFIWDISTPGIIINTVGGLISSD